MFHTYESDIKRNSHRYIFLFFGLYFLTITILKAQPQAVSQEGVQQEIPTSPGVSSLHKFIEAPVDNFTGVPAIGIPIYQVQDGNVSIPISINYHASGIKVDEVASSVGIGWSLNAGGIISRQINSVRPERIAT